ncbi:MAG: FliM/FliN family flagellar motor switch protein [Mariprofundaceae bacterium]|nr:FliM/FliN family flagellar motor switch protein [Mariprofundaceae bacterium]
MSEDNIVADVETGGEGVRPNLEVIMHVPLEISVELGRVNMPLHAVTRLGRGTVVDLKKEANAEVNILANGQVFARGEVVTADGKLGVRIVDVIPPGERVRSLG